jgi:hypothetical protein
MRSSCVEAETWTGQCVFVSIVITIFVQKLIDVQDLFLKEKLLLWKLSM